ncbi:MAG: DUF4349 domain-containing protein [Chloroflexi bacterium]|nr:DUF4349 domain-containing protein [Chloroflexota bacterium]MBU1746069.1 DUF4349 domain-containing protein [Chloroflexota bacterium]
MKRLKPLMALLALAVILGMLGAAQCAPAAQPRVAAQPTGAPAAPTRAPEPTPAPGAAPASGEGGDDAGGPTAPGAASQSTPPMIIKTATMTLVVPDVENSLDDLTRIAATAGGYIVTSQTQMRDDQVYASVVLRVPVSGFEATLERVRALAREIRTYRVAGTDVTGEYVDLQSRVKHLQAVEQELLAIMTEVRQKSDSAEEVLKIYDRILTVQAEIETAKGRMEYLSNQATFSTITVDLEPVIEPAPTPTPTPTATPTPTPTPAVWYPDETLNDAVSSWVTVVQAFIDLGIWLSVYGTCLIPLAVVLGVVLLIWYLMRRRQARAKKAAP